MKHEMDKEMIISTIYAVIVVAAFVLVCMI
mgnify:CR=1 FL=1